MKKKWIGVILLFATAPFTTIEGVYQYQVARMGTFPVTSAHAQLPPRVEKGIWALFGEEGEPGIEPVYSWDILRLFISVVNGEVERLEIKRGGFICGYVAKMHLLPTHEGQRISNWHLKNFALAMWLSRNWKTEEVLAKAHDQIYVLGARGFDNAAIRLFGKDEAELRADELATILALAKRGTEQKMDLGNGRLVAGRDRLLKKMFENAAIGKDEYEQSLRQPIVIKWSLKNL